MNECYGIRAEEIARRCRVDVKTARRWKTGVSRIPETAKMILTGDLGYLDTAFQGWRLRDGKLISPEGWETAPGDVLSIPLLRAQVSAYQAAERRVQGMEEQPVSADATAMLAQIR